jgi:hypothetical protein
VLAVALLLTVAGFTLVAAGVKGGDLWREPWRPVTELLSGRYPGGRFPAEGEPGGPEPEQPAGGGPPRIGAAEYLRLVARHGRAAIDGMIAAGRIVVVEGKP